MKNRLVPLDISESSELPILDPHLDPERHVNASNGFQDGEVLGGIVDYVTKGSNPRFSDKSRQLLHAQFSMVVFRDLNGRLKVRIGVEVIKHLLLNVPVLTSHVTRQRWRVHAQLPSPAARCNLQLFRRHARDGAQVQGQPPDSPLCFGDWLGVGVGFGVWNLHFGLEGLQRRR